MKTQVFVILSIIVSVLVATSMIGMAQESEVPADSEGQPPKEESAINKIDINAATLEELESLVGIGPKLAQMIIDGRPYKKVEDLLEVKGIGEKKLEKIRHLIEVKQKALSEEAEGTQEQKKEEEKIE